MIFTLEPEPYFPAGTSVSVYKSLGQLANRTGPPPGELVEVATVSTTGKLVLEGLSEHLSYVAYAHVAGKDQYIGFRTDVGPGGGTEGGVSPAEMTLVQSQIATIDTELQTLSSELQGLGGQTAAPAAPVLTNPGPQEWTVGQAIALQLGGSNVTSYKVVSGLAFGLTLVLATGLISGTLTTAESPTAVIEGIGPGGTTLIRFSTVVKAVAGVPVVTTLPATSVTAQSAVLNGALNPKGVDCKFRFQHGATTAYGSQTTEEDGGSGTSTVDKTATITGGGLLIGAALNYEGVVEKSYGDAFVPKFLAECDSWTVENELKMINTYNSGGRSIPTAANVVHFREMFETLKTANSGVDKLVRKHNLVWIKNEFFAEWVTNPTVAWTATTFKDAFKNYIQRVVAAVEAITPGGTWDVINEAVSDEGLLVVSKVSEVLGGGTAITATNPQMIFFAECFKWVHEIAPTARLFDNEYNAGVPEKSTKTAAVLTFAKVLLALGAPINGIGTQMHQNTEWSPSKAEVEQFGKEVEELGLEPEITELDIELKGAGTTTTQGTLATHMAEGAKAASYKRITTWGFSDVHSYQGPNTLTTGTRPLPYDTELKPKAFAVALEAARGAPLSSSHHFRFVGFPTGLSPIYGADMTLAVIGQGAPTGEAATGIPVPRLGSDSQTVEWASVASETEYTVAVSNEARGGGSRKTGYLTQLKGTNPQKYKPTIGTKYFNSEGEAFTAATGKKVWVGVFANGEWSASEVEVTLPGAPEEQVEEAKGGLSSSANLVVTININNWGGQYDWNNAKATGALVGRTEYDSEHPITLAEHCTFAHNAGMGLLWIVEPEGYLFSLAKFVSEYNALSSTQKAVLAVNGGGVEGGNENWLEEGAGTKMTGKQVAEGFLKLAAEALAAKLPFPVLCQAQTSPKEKLDWLEQMCEVNLTELKKAFEPTASNSKGNGLAAHCYGTGLQFGLQEANNLGNTNDENGQQYGSNRWLHAVQYLKGRLGYTVPCYITEIGMGNNSEGGWGSPSTTDAEIANYDRGMWEAIKAYKENKLTVAMSKGIPTGLVPVLWGVSKYALYAWGDKGYGVFVGTSEHRTQEKIWEINVAGIAAVNAA